MRAFLKGGSMRSALVTAFVLIASLMTTWSAGQVQAPQQFFGFAIGADGELARYPKVLEYLQHLANTTNRLKYEELGKTTMGHPYVLATISSPENLGRMDRLVAINRRLADPRGLSEAEARKLALEGRPFYLLFTTIHSTEVGNMQAIIEVAHRLATSGDPEIRDILENVVLLLVPSQNPDGQVMVIDHWYKTKGTAFNRVFPDLYHKYTGHDDNRDWFMFTQKETRMAVEMQNRLRPHLTHDMHQQGPAGSRIFVPPYEDPYDRNVHPLIAQQQLQVGQAMATALIAEGKGGVAFAEQYDLWTPARQYMVYHGQPRILTEIASASLADPFVNPAGADRPLGPQEPRWNFPLPYRRPDWRLRQIVDYGITAVFAGLSHMAKYRTSFLENAYRIHADWVNRKETPYAFVISAAQRDPFEAYELLQIMRFADVEIHRAKSPFMAGGQSYPAGSFVIKTAQPYGAFAKTMLEKQVYPDLRLFPGGPPKPPYDVTGHTLGMLMGVDVAQVDQAFDAALEPVAAVTPPAPPLPPRPRWAYLVGPESNAAFLAVARLQKVRVPIFRAARGFESYGRTYAPGTWIVAPTPAAAKVLEEVARATGLEVHTADRPVQVDGFRLKTETRIGLWRGANNMPGGWLMWLFEQYGFNHQVVSAPDSAADGFARYDTIVLPSGISKETIVTGLDPATHDKEFSWAYGIGDAGWKKLAEWVRNGGTLVAIGSAVETARELLDLPIEKVLPEFSRRRRSGASSEAGGKPVPPGELERVLRETFTSPARLAATLRERVIEPTSLFYCPGSLLNNEFDTAHPVAFGMPASWPVFFESDQAYRLAPGFLIRGEVVARYPKRGSILASGWLLGEELLHDQANVVSFQVGKGQVVTLASQVDFRTQPRATFKLLFNPMFHGRSTAVDAVQLAKLTLGTTNDD
jgi:Zinc carboxypeptidase